MVVVFFPATSCRIFLLTFTQTCFSSMLFFFRRLTDCEDSRLSSSVDRLHQTTAYCCFSQRLDGIRLFFQKVFLRQALTG